MKHEPIATELFSQNRANVAKNMKPSSMAVFHSNDTMPTSADGTMPFKQHSDIYYLTGVAQEESILILCPDAHDEKYREILFLRETNDFIARWEGQKLTQKEAQQRTGIRTILWTSQFKKVCYELAFQCERIYLNTNEHLRANIEIQTRDDRFIEWTKKHFPLHQYERIAPIMHRLRAIKSPLEIELLQEACRITEKGFRRVLNFLKPNLMEYEIEAEFIHEFIRNRSTGFAYAPIIASGANACILHYIENNKPCRDGDLLLIDVGAEYAGYAADMTRTVPVNGRFTPRQKAIYNAVLKVQREAFKLLEVGNNWINYHQQVGEIMTQELIALGLLDKHEVRNQNPDAPLYKKYFMHGTSHHLGLDVHDYGSIYHTFEAGMVFTCEPGIYIPEENIGIRLENDVVITDDGIFDLMQNIPILNNISH